MSWLTGWTYRKSISISRPSGAVTNYQMKLNLRRASGNDTVSEGYLGQKPLENLYDIRFTKANGETLLDCWREFSGIFPYSPYASNPILSPTGGEDHTTFACVLKDGSTYHMYYMYHDAGNAFQIGHATSSDGKSWTKDTANNPIFVKGTSGKFDDFEVRTPMVWKEGSTWYMIYTGYTTAGGGAFAIGLATSLNGISWTRQNSGNAVLSSSSGWDANQCENWGVIKIGSVYYLWYNRVAVTRQSGLATSTDLINWTKDPNNPIFDSDRFCPFSIKYGSFYYLFIPHYTSGTDFSEIELYRDSNPTFYPANRTLLGICKIPNRVITSPDYHDQDTPCVLTDDIERDSFSASGNEFWMYYAGEQGGVWKECMTIDSNIEACLNIGGTFWIEIDLIPIDSTTIYVYYGNAIASDQSSGDNTFIFFDHFPGSSIDLTKWDVTAGDVSVASSILTLAGTTGTRGTIYTDTFFGINSALRWKMKTSSIRATNSHPPELELDGTHLIYLYGGAVDLGWILSTSDGSNSQSNFTFDETRYFYRIYDLTWKSGQSKVYQENSLKVTKTTNIPSDGNFKTKAREGTIVGEDILVDWIFRRKWVDPEPAWGIWGSEEGSASGMTISGISTIQGISSIQS